MGETRFEKVYEDLLKFLNEGIDQKPTADGKKQLVPVFVHDNHMRMIKSVLSQLTENPDDVEHDIDVLSLNTLFNELKNVDAPDQKSRISIHVSNMLLDADRYDSAQNIACDYHEEADASLQCAMSICRRWCYTFCDHICTEKLNVPLRAGVHLPDNSDVNAQPLVNYDDRKVNQSSFHTVGAGHSYTESKISKCEKYDSSDSSGYTGSRFHPSNPFAFDHDEWPHVGRQPASRSRSNYH